MKNILFICSVNKQRSKTAEDYFSEKYPDFEFLSAGTNLKLCRKEGTNPLTEILLEWADFIYVMEIKHNSLINKRTGNKYNAKIKVLGIQDRFKYYDRKLIELLESKIDLS